MDKPLNTSGSNPCYPVLFLTLLLLNISCRHSPGNVKNIGQVRFDPENIIIADSNNIKIDLQSNGISTDLKIDSLESGLYHLRFIISAEKPFKARNLEIRLQYMSDRPDNWDEVKHSFHWVPSLKKDPGDIISQHVFRSPAIILTHRDNAVSVIPDLDDMKTSTEIPFFMNLYFLDKGIFVSYGLSKYRTKNHVYYEHSDSSFTIPQKIELTLYLICKNGASPLDILKSTNRFLWNKFGRQYTDSISPQVVPFRHYAESGYDMGLSKYWVNGPKPVTGGITLSTFLDSATGVYRGRENKDDLWFHSWFNNARTAYGLYLWGKEISNQLWMDKALSVMNLLLESPCNDGFFKTIWVPEKNVWISSGQGGGPDLYHVPDNAWTAIWLLRFNDELKKLPGADKFLTDFAQGLLNIQLADGSFPARIKVSGLTPDSVLMNSASGAMATWFLEEMILRKKLAPGVDERAREAVTRSLSFLEEEILPVNRFQDYEVFLSCAPNALNRFDSLTWLYPHNTLSIQWSAEAFLKAYRIFGRNNDLDNGEYCLNLLSLYQQVWNPPYISFYAFGGFGVQNTDAEWSDARQAQFAETYLNFFLTTGNREYLQRSIAACRASFALMDIPENKYICPLNYQGTPFNGEFTGAMAENFGHSGYNQRSGQSGFHWGTGSALTSAAIFRMKLGNIYIDSRSRVATGIDGVLVENTIWGDTIKLVTKKLPDLTHLKIYGDKDLIAGKKVIIDNNHKVEAICQSGDTAF